MAGTTQPQDIGPNIALLGFFGSANIGNEATLDAMIHHLKRDHPDARLTCICVGPDNVVARHGIEARKMTTSPFKSIPAKIMNRLLLRTPAHVRNIGAAYATLRKTDILIVPGTGVFDDYWTPSVFGFPFQLLTWCALGRHHGAQILLLSIGAGPAQSRVCKKVFALVARTAHFRSYRDADSKRFVRSIGVDVSNNSIYPDLAIGLQLPVVEPTFADGQAPLTICLGVMRYYGWHGEPSRGQHIFNHYIERLSAFVVHQLKSGNNFRFMIGEDADAGALAALLASVKAVMGDVDPLRLVSESVTSFADVAREIQRSDIVVATRYHNVVCALMCHRPTISLSYAPKNEEVMSLYGLGEFCQQIETFDVSLLVSQVERIKHSYRHWVDQLSAVEPGLRAKLAEQEALVASKILAIRPSAGT